MMNRKILIELLKEELIINDIIGDPGFIIDDYKNVIEQLQSEGIQNESIVEYIVDDIY